MTETVQVLLLDLLEWLTRQNRTYEETMDSWRTSCPKLPVWEEAVDRGYISIEKGRGASNVHPTSDGLAFLRKHRPVAG